SLTGTSASALNLSGSSVLLLGGDNSNFFGTATLDAGTRLAVNGLFGGSVVVNGTLAGNGSIARSVTVQSGVIAPGQNAAVVPNSPGFTPTTLTIGGNFTQQAGGTYKANIFGTGQSDRLNITGSAALDGTLNVHALSGNYTTGTQYT